MIANRTLSFSERRDFMALLNNNGYVLDFSSANFDAFTHEIVGVALTEKY